MDYKSLSIEELVRECAQDPNSEAWIDFERRFKRLIGSVVIAIGTDASGLLGPATLGGTLTVAALSGVASFGDLTIDKPGIGYTLQVTSPDVSGGPFTSHPFTVLTLP